MVSQLAMEDVESIQREGGYVHPSDVVRLNALGLRITEHPECELSTLPRIASYNGVQFRQPTIEQEIFLDDILRRIDVVDEGTRLAITAYVLSHPCRHKWLFKSNAYVSAVVSLFVKTKLKNMTAEQLRRIVDYCMIGIDPVTGEYPVMMLDDSSEGEDDRIGGDSSWALFNYLRSVSLGIDSVAALRSTSEHLSALIERAYIARGSDLKSEEKRVTAEYYATLDEIRKNAFKKDGEDG